MLFAGVAAIAAFAAGCGSSSDDSGSGETTVVLTKAEFIKQGDAICKKGSQQIEDEADAFAKENNIDKNNPSKKEQEEVIAVVFAPALQGQADELSELGPPNGEAEKIIEALESGIEQLENDPGSLLKSGTGPLDKANELANEYGFKECGQE